MLNKSYLIQRAKFANYVDTKGLDGILNFDYMGSAEFEFGSLPKSLKRIRDNIDNYILISEEIHGIKIKVFCPKNYIDDMADHLLLLANGRMHTKEFTDFNNVVNQDRKERWLGTQFWWDIDNDFMWWLANKTFTKKFKKHIFTVIQKSVPLKKKPEVKSSIPEFRCLLKSGKEITVRGKTFDAAIKLFGYSQDDVKKRY